MKKHISQKSLAPLLSAKETVTMKQLTVKSMDYLDTDSGEMLLFIDTSYDIPVA